MTRSPKMIIKNTNLFSQKASINSKMSIRSIKFPRKVIVDWFLPLSIHNNTITIFKMHKINTIQKAHLAQIINLMVYLCTLEEKSWMREILILPTQTNSKTTQVFLQVIHILSMIKESVTSHYTNKIGHILWLIDKSISIWWIQ